MAGTSIVAEAATSERNSDVEFYANTWAVLVNSSFVMEGGS